MKKFTFSVLFITLFSVFAIAQSGYDIKINLKNCYDTQMFLVKYVYDKQYVEDTCAGIKNGQIQFKGALPLDKGVYAIVSPSMVRYFDVFVNESQKFTITGDLQDLSHSLKSLDSKENETMFTYGNFMAARDQEFKKTIEQTKGKSKPDSLAMVSDKKIAMNADVKKFETAFMEKHKGSFVVEFLNLRTEKYAPDVPKAKNGRPDSVYQYYYYKNHYFDGVNFKDGRIVHTPFFADRVRKYMNQVIIQHPDTVIAELDKLLGRCTEGNLVFNRLIGDFTYQYEQNKTMSFDKAGKTTTFEKVFVHLGENYIVNGKAKEMYSEETTQKIRERVEILRNLLPEAKVSDLYLIDTVQAAKVRKMGFDTAGNSKSLTDLYFKNENKIKPLFKSLYEIKAKYTILVFWAVDCDHCKKEIPTLQANMKALKGIDVKVLAVQTKDELYEDWRKFIIDKKLDFINLYDPIHINNIKERFDINSTPVIYLLDKDKKIKGKKLTANQVVEIIRNLENIEKL